MEPRHFFLKLVGLTELWRAQGASSENSQQVRDFCDHHALQLEAVIRRALPQKKGGITGAAVARRPKLPHSPYTEFQRGVAPQSEMIHRAVRCLGLLMVEEKMAQGVVDADGGKKQVAYHFSFSFIEEWWKGWRGVKFLLLGANF